MSARLEKFKDESRGFETWRDLAAKHRSAKWVEVQAYMPLFDPMMTESGDVMGEYHALGIIDIYQ